MSQTINTSQSPQSIESLLERTHQAFCARDSAWLMTFEVDEGSDAYNPTAPFDHFGQQVVAARVESRDSELGSSVQFFYQQNSDNNHWLSLPDAPTFIMQDPFLSQIQDSLVVGGVHTYVNPSTQRIDGWETLFYGGPSLGELALVAMGPLGMKDVRPVELASSQIGVFTRPQGGEAGRGRVGFTIIDRLAEIDEVDLNSAPLVGGFIDAESGDWGGVNQAIANPDGTVEVVAHLARFLNDGRKQYLPVSFLFDPVSYEVADQQILACRDCFPDTPAKRPELSQVVYPGGLVQKMGQKMLYVGLSDANSAGIML
ncbi:MAG: DUF1861 family protein [Patescibacteria group bacterium]